MKIQGSYSKLTSGVSNEYHLPYEMGPDGRVAKIPRTESRDVDRRSPLHSMYRMPPSSNESHVDSHLNVAPESRPESRDSEDSRDYRIENRDPRTDATEVYGEARRDSQSVKNEKDVRFESRGDDNKEVKHDREAHIEPKNDMKIEKDGFGPASSQVNWKETKEYHRRRRARGEGGRRKSVRIFPALMQLFIQLGQHILVIVVDLQSDTNYRVSANYLIFRASSTFGFLKGYKVKAAITAYQYLHILLCLQYPKKNRVCSVKSAIVSGGV
ncbi:hypothetical protein POTOM_057807 [Populus tomentosa]|uniref:Uncharacterized protein n=1 Tax=Populus tomentosa TaxID=118781 RepID=A0A8X8C062_POPTO|nr:hypothetical protein POTOM_057807 [Populus tomentosa]